MRLGFTPQQAYLFALLAVLLMSVAGTVLCGWLESRPLTPVGEHRLKVVASRVRASWGLVLLFSISYWLGYVGLVLFFAVISFFALREFLALTPARPEDHTMLVVAFYIAIPAQYVLVGFRLEQSFSAFIPVYLFLLLPIVALWKKTSDAVLDRVAKIQWGLMLAVFCVSHAPAIAAIDSPVVARYNSSGDLLLLYFMLVVYFMDLFSVMASALLGGNPVPHNAHKTTRGIAVGSAAAMAVGLAFFWLTPFRFWQAALMSLLVVVAGNLGDIAVMAIKRSLGVKVFDGASLRLTRRTLDHIAPITFAAPLFYHVSTFFFFGEASDSMKEAVKDVLEATSTMIGG